MATAVASFLSKSLTENYKQVCKNDRTEPNEAVLKQLNGADSGNVICNLSTVNMCAKSCRSFGTFLSTDTHFTELRLTDCLLQEEALSNILERITQNSSLVTLDLKGNAMKMEAGQALGTFLKLNRCLKRLNLEWNNIGVYPEVVAAISEGLGLNTSLQELILRNNQISHVGVTDLATALKKNTTLKILDLRWNNIGLLGGRTLTDALKANRSLIQLELTGNNISIDTLNAIETALKYNCEHKIVTEEQKRRENLLKMGLRRAEVEKTEQMNDLVSRLSEEQLKSEQIHRNSTSAISNLQYVLDERLGVIKSMEAKMAAMEKTLVIRDKEIKDSEDRFLDSRQEISDLRAQHLNILKQERDRHAEREEALLDEIRILREDKIQIFADMKRTNENSQLEQQKAAKIWEELLNRSTETMQKREEDFKKQIAEEKEKMAEKLNEWMKKEREMKDKQHTDQLEREKLKEMIKTLEKDLRSVSNELNEEKMKLKMEKQDGGAREMKIQGKYDEIQKSFTSTAENLAELNAKFESNRRELEIRREEVANLQSKLVSKEENDRVLAQLRHELQDAHVREKESRLNAEMVSSRLKSLEKEMMDLENKKNNQIKEKDGEIAVLNEKHKLREEEWKKMAEKEEKRINGLRKAIEAYLNQ